MILRINNIVPIPLKEKLSVRNSGIWNTTVSFTNNDRIKLKAPSGSGKTTLIHILYDLRRDFDGEVQINDRSLPAMDRSEKALLRQQTVSIIFQDLRLFPNLTARENIELKRVLQKPLYEKNVIDEMAVRLGVDHILDQRAGICSYGEQQRVAIIRALMQPFELLLMDEPFSHLDNENAYTAAALITEECNKRNAAFLLTDLEDDDHFSYTQKLVL
jgi:ABC-type lipoprotein export system ATPase subunit